VLPLLPLLLVLLVLLVLVLLSLLLPRPGTHHVNILASNHSAAVDWVSPGNQRWGRAATLAAQLVSTAIYGSAGPV
jgi:hypothetical protein